MWSGSLGFVHVWWCWWWWGLCALRCWCWMGYMWSCNLMWSSTMTHRLQVLGTMLFCSPWFWSCQPERSVNLTLIFHNVVNMQTLHLLATMLPKTQDRSIRVVLVVQAAGLSAGFAILLHFLKSGVDFGRSSWPSALYWWTHGCAFPSLLIIFFLCPLSTFS